MEVQVNTASLLEPTHLSEREEVGNVSCAAEKVGPESSVSILLTGVESSTIRPTGRRRQERDNTSAFDELRGSVLSCFRKHAVLWSAVGIVFIAVVCGGTGYAIGSRSGKEDAKRPPAACCPDDWLKIQGKCFYFSKAEGNWTNSQNNCSSLGASLVGFDSPEALDSLLPYPARLNHWVGLRKDTDGVWRWVNGTKFDRRFEIQGDANCAALDERIKVISSSCSSQRKWICSKLHTPHNGGLREHKS